MVFGYFGKELLKGVREKAGNFLCQSRAVGGFHKPVEKTHCSEKNKHETDAFASRFKRFRGDGFHSFCDKGVKIRSQNNGAPYLIQHFIPSFGPDASAPVFLSVKNIKKR